MSIHARIPLAVALLTVAAAGAKVETLSYASLVLGRNATYVVMRPTDYDEAVGNGERFPVLYLLHGAAHGASEWVSGEYCNCVARIIDNMRFMVVAPDDGEGNNWWLDSPVRTDSDMSEFVAVELKQKIDGDYATYADRDNTAIAGQSMGGFGALHNSLRHPDVYGFCMAIKPGVDLLNPSWPMDFGLTAVLGSKTTNRANWEEASIMPHAAEFLDIDVALRMFAGKNDAWFYQEDAGLHALWDSLGVEHDYIELNEVHGGVSETTMNGILGYVDTAFAYENSSGAKRDSARPSQHGRLMQTGTGILTPLHLASSGLAVYAVTGRRLSPHRRRSLPTGIYVFANEPAIGIVFRSMLQPCSGEDDLQGSWPSP
jgi:S-formylglutathione hydrolase FrmB